VERVSRVFARSNLHNMNCNKEIQCMTYIWLIFIVLGIANYKKIKCRNVKFVDNSMLKCHSYLFLCSHCTS